MATTIVRHMPDRTRMSPRQLDDLHVGLCLLHAATMPDSRFERWDANDPWMDRMERVALVMEFADLDQLPVANR